MKNLLLLGMIALFASCGGKKDQASEEKAMPDTLYTFVADTSASNIAWQRDVENKVENKQIQIFGATATVNMENVAYTSNGEMPLISGKLEFINDSLSGLELTTNFTMVRLFSKGSGQAISSETFPPSLLEAVSIKPDTAANTFRIKGELSMKDKKGPVEFLATILRNKEGAELNGQLVLQTLDWPIREDVNPANVKKDIIVLDLSIKFAMKERLIKES